MGKKKKKVSEGDVLRGFRVLCRMSREDLAEKIGVTYHAVGSWETGKREPRISMLKSIGKQFGEYEDLFWQTLKKAEDIE
jgi:DNA-binding XRE family transcriptional regulator